MLCPAAGFVAELDEDPLGEDDVWDQLDLEGLSSAFFAAHA